MSLWTQTESLIVFVKNITPHNRQAVETETALMKKQNDALLLSGPFCVLIVGLPLSLVLQRSYFPALCSVTDKPPVFALSLVPADGAVVLETAQRRTGRSLTGSE